MSAPPSITRAAALGLLASGLLATWASAQSAGPGPMVIPLWPEGPPSARPLHETGGWDDK